MLFNYPAPKIELVRVVEGDFRMGVNNPRSRANPEHSVFLKEYEIGKYLVTNDQYLNFVLDIGHHMPTESSSKKWFTDDQRNHPVSGISWSDAWLFCTWLSNKTGEPYHLPTEAQWEKAATWNSETLTRQLFPWGDTFNSEYCNVSASDINQPTPVGSYSPQGDSPYGCADMIGNLDEWCHSVMAPYPYHANDGRELLIAERVTGIPRRVIRGGDWYTVTEQSPFRRNAPSDWWQHLWGFRVARSSAVDDGNNELMQGIMADIDHDIQLRNEMIEANPKNPQEWYNRGAWFIELHKLGIRKFEQAEADISHAIELLATEGDSLLTVPLAWLYFNRGIARLQVRKFNGAFDDLSESLSLDPSDISAYLIRAEVAIAQKNWTQADKDIKMMSNTPFSKVPKIELFRAQILAGLGQFPEAINKFTTLIKQPQWTSLGIPELYLYRGQVYEEQGNLEASLSDYYHYLLWNPSTSHASTLQAKIENYQNQQL